MGRMKNHRAASLVSPLSILLALFAVFITRGFATEAKSESQQELSAQMDRAWEVTWSRFYLPKVQTFGDYLSSYEQGKEQAHLADGGGGETPVSEPLRLQHGHGGWRDPGWRHAQRAVRPFCRHGRRIAAGKGARRVPGAAALRHGAWRARLRRPQRVSGGWHKRLHQFLTGPGHSLRPRPVAVLP